MFSFSICFLMRDEFRSQSRMGVGGASVLGGYWLPPRSETPAPAAAGTAATAAAAAPAGGGAPPGT